MTSRWRRFAIFLWAAAGGAGGALAAEVSPGTFDAALTAQREGRQGEALSDFLRFLAEQPGDKRSDEAIRNVWEIAQAIKKSEQALVLDPKSWRQTVQTAKAVVAKRQRQTQELMTDFQRVDEALSKGGSSLDALRAVGLEASRAHINQMDDISRALAQRHLAAIRERLNALASSHDLSGSDLHEIRGYYWLYQGDLEQAAKEWEQASALKPDDRALSERLDDVKNQWRVQKNREEAEHELLLGQTDYKSGRFAKAQAHFQRVLTLDPANEEGLRYQEFSAQALSTATNQERIAALLVSGQGHYEAGKLLEAVQDWVNVLVLDPSNPEARRNLDRIRKRMTFEQTSAPAKNEPQGQRRASDIKSAQDAYYLALIEYTDGDLEKAKAHFEEALRDDPSFEKARKGLEQVQTELSNR